VSTSSIYQPGLRSPAGLGRQPLIHLIHPKTLKRFQLSLGLCKHLIVSPESIMADFEFSDAKGQVFTKLPGTINGYSHALLRLNGLILHMFQTSNA